MDFFLSKSGFVLLMVCDSLDKIHYKLKKRKGFLSMIEWNIEGQGTLKT